MKYKDLKNSACKWRGIIAFRNKVRYKKSLYKNLVTKNTIVNTTWRQTWVLKCHYREQRKALGRSSLFFVSVCISLRLRGRATTVAWMSQNASMRKTSISRPFSISHVSRYVRSSQTLRTWRDSYSRCDGSFYDLVSRASRGTGVLRISR